MAVTSMCEQCFATFPATAKTIGKEVKCPICGERTLVQATETNDEQGPTPTNATSKAKKSKADPQPPSRAKPKKQASKAKSRSSNGFASLLGLIYQLRFAVMAMSVLAIIGVMVWKIAPGKRSQAQKTYHGEHGSPRTTREWLAMVKENEANLRTGTEQAKNQDVLHRRMTGDIVQFLGPDPAAIPDLFEALANEEYPRLRFIANEVLKKFELSPEKPIAEDVFAGLTHPNPRVSAWSTRLMAKLGADAKPKIGELAKALDAANNVSAPAITNSLAAIGGDALPVLTAHLEKAPNEATPSVIRAIGRMGPVAEPVVPKLAGFLADKDASLRSAALQALQALGPTAKPAVPNLIDFLEKSATDNEVKAAFKILSNPQLEALADLTKLLKSDSIRTRKRAIETLSSLDQAAVPALPTLVEISKKPADNQEERDFQNSVKQLLTKLGKVNQPEEAIVAPPAGALEALEELTYQTLRARINGKQKGETKSTGEIGGQRGQFGVFTGVSEFFDADTQTQAQILNRRVNEEVALDPKDVRGRNDPKLDLALSQGKTVREVVGREDSETLTWSQGDRSYFGQFLDRKRSGPWIRKHANGRVWVMGAYSSDSKSGQFVIHDEAGKRIWVGVYQENRLVSTPKPVANAGFIAVPLEAAPSLFEFEPNGRRLAVAQGTLLVLYDCETWQECGHQSLPGAIKQFDFASSGSALLVTVERDDKTNAKFVCDGATGVIKLELPATVTKACLSADGRWAAGLRRVSDSHSELAVYDVNSAQIKFEHDASEAVPSTPSGRGEIGFESVSFSPDGRWLAVGGKAATHMFDVASGQIHKRFDLPLTNVHFMAGNDWLLGVVHDGQRAKIDCDTGIASGFGWKAGSEAMVMAGGRSILEVSRKRGTQWITNVKSINLQTGQESFSRNFGDWAPVAISPNGEFLALFHEKNGAVWSVRTGEVVKQLPELHSGWFSNRGLLLAAFESHWQSDNRRIQVLNLATDQRRVIEVPTPRIQNLTPLRLSPDGRFLVVAQNDLTLTVWDLADLAKLPDVVPPAVAEAAQKPALRFDDWQEVAVRTPQAMAPADMERQQINVGMAAGRSGGKSVSLEPGYYGLVFSPDQKMFLAHGQSAIRLWQIDANPKTAIAGFAPAVSGRAVFSPDGKVLCCGNQNGYLNFWDMKKGELFPNPKPEQSTGQVSQVCFSSDGKLVASADGNAKTVRLWDVSKRKVQKKLDGFPDEMLGVAFGADDSQLACVDGRGVFQIIDLANDGRTKITFPNSVNYARLHAMPKTQHWLMPHYSHAAKLTLIPFAAPHTPVEISLKQSPEESSMPTCCSITADEQYVAVATNDAKVLLVNLLERKVQRVLHGHVGTLSGVSGVAFTPDDEFLITTGQDRTLRVWGRGEFPFPLNAALPGGDSKSKPATKPKPR